MADIATLGIKVTTEGVAQATSQLNQLYATSQQTAKSAKAVAEEWRKATFSDKQLFSANQSLARFRENLNGAEKNVNKLALSQKQLIAAQRQLPAQFTDIFTGLASGQAPLQVLIQQGGQLKDTFGGVGPALRASAGYISGLINPVTLLAAAGVALGLAWKQQQDQLDEFNISLAKTNNFIGLTAQQLAEYSDEIAAAGEATVGTANETVNRIVAGGRLTQDQFRQISQSVAEFSALTGESIDSIVKKYEDLAKDPLDALLKLNESERFLTQAQYDRVEALQEEGRQQEAATEAIRIYAENMDRATQQVRGNLSEISRLWLDVKNAASAAWQEIGNVADAIAGVTRRQAEANTRLIAGLAASARNLNPAASLGTVTGFVRGVPNWFTGGGRADFSNVQSRVLGRSQAIDSNALREQIKAQEEFDRLRVSNLSKAAKLEEEIADIRKKGLAAGKSEAEIQKTIADARARFKESLPKGSSGGSRSDPTASILQQLRQQIALNEEQANSERTLTESQRLRIRVTEQLEALGGKVSASRRAEIQAELERLNTTDAAVQKAKEQIQVESSLLRLREQIARTEAARAQANRVDLLGIGRGAEEVERQRRALDIEYDYQNELRELYRQAAREKREVTRQEEDDLRASRDRMLDMERDYFAERAQMQADWRNGAVRALEDYMAEANDVASRTAEAIDGVLNSLQGTFEEFFRTGKLDWKGFLDDINAELARFFSQQLVKQLLSSFGGGAQSGAMASGSASSGVDWAGIIGSFFGGGRASGGPVRKGMLYEVGERGPELLQSGGRNYMIPGRDGYVQPNGAAASGGNVYVQPTIMVQGRVDPRTADQIGTETARKAQTAMARNR